MPQVGRVCAFATFDFERHGNQMMFGVQRGGQQIPGGQSGNNQQMSAVQNNANQMSAGQNTLSKSILQTNGNLNTRTENINTRTENGNTRTENGNTRTENEKMVSLNGKMELSFVNFKNTYPDWDPGNQGSEFLTQINNRMHSPEYPEGDKRFYQSYMQDSMAESMRFGNLESKPVAIGKEIVSLLDAIYETNRRNK
jgi:hypothetical protein